MSTVHIVGAGLAGLSASVAIAPMGRRVRLYEAAPQAGGRCRSYFDPQLDRVIDNGGHVVLGANHAVFAYLDTIGGRDELIEIAPAAFPFLDLTTGATWQVRPNAGRVPWWTLSPSRRIPGTRAADYWQIRRLLAAGPDTTVGDVFDPPSALFTRLMEPLATAVMNTAPYEAAARPLANVLRDTFLHGESACRASIARRGLSQAFVDPALKLLERYGTELRAGTRLQAVQFHENRVEALDFTSGTVPLGEDDAVILCVPPAVASALMPELTHPHDVRAIVNAHFRLDEPARLPGGLPLLGLVGGTAQWLIARDDVVSVTISAADSLIDRPAADMLSILWRDTATALGQADRALPPARLIKERRATFAQTPAAERQRPGTRTRWANLYLAGDWTATGVPATIEGAIRSGTAAAAALAAM